jgi:SAM-dependent methyltransferase
VSADPGSASPPERPESRPSWLRRALKRVVGYLLHDELAAFHRRQDDLANSQVVAADANARLVASVADQAQRIEDARRDLAAVAADSTRDIATLARDAGNLQAAHDALRYHLELRQDQANAELTELRIACLGSGDGLAGATTGRLPILESRLDSLAGTVRALQSELEAVRDVRLLRIESDAASLQSSVNVVQGELAEVRDARLGGLAADLASVQHGLVDLLAEVEQIRDVRLGRLEADHVSGAAAVAAVQAVAEEIRDSRLPALNGRVESLVSRLHEEIESTGGLLDRLIAREPLRVAARPGVEERIPEAVGAAWHVFMEEHRGAVAEVAGRAASYIELLVGATPVLDLGCGRGELLELLQAHGATARGIEADPALVASCRRAGLEVAEGDVVEALRATTTGSLGAVVAVHLLEHLPAATWMTVIDEAARVLRPGGLLIVECPNPGALRVGASLFWLDPTHHVPVHPDAVAFVARAVGLEVLATRFLHDFPADQSLQRSGQSPEVRELAERLDAWLSAPRDFSVLARKPE